MSTITEEPITRDVGERVDLLFNLDQSTVKDLGEGSFSATITTSDVDRQGEQIDTAGVSTDTYMANPVVLYGHDYQGLPIGKTIKLRAFNNKITASFQLAVNEYPFAATVAKLIKGGYLNAVSIGGIVKQWDPSYTKIQQMEMVEFSVVPVPANAGALITRSIEETLGKTKEDLKKEYEDFVLSTMQTKLKAVDSKDVKDYIELLKNLTAILEGTFETSEKDTTIEADEVITLVMRKTAGQVSEAGQKIIRLVKAKEKENE